MEKISEKSVGSVGIYEKRCLCFFRNLESEPTLSRVRMALADSRNLTVSPVSGSKTLFVCKFGV